MINVQSNEHNPAPIHEAQNVLEVQDLTSRGGVKCVPTGTHHWRSVAVKVLNATFSHSD